MNKALKTVGNNKGFTLLEFVVVVALAAVVMVATAMLITKGKESAAFSSVKDNIQIIQAGLAERKVFSPKMPLAATSSTTWPTDLDPYIPADLRADGNFPHGYKCAAADNQVVIETPVLDDAKQATSVLQRLKDAGTCTAASTAASSKISCILTAFDGTANCS